MSPGAQSVFKCIYKFQLDIPEGAITSQLPAWDKAYHVELTVYEAPCDSIKLHE